MDSASLIEYLQNRAAILAVRMPLSWVNLAAGSPRTVDGRTLDARTQWLLKLIEKSGRPPLERMPVPAARIAYDESMRLLSGAWLPDTMLWGGDAALGEIVDFTIPGPGGKLAVRVYRPAGIVGRAVPGMLFLHGGGWTVGSLDSHDAPCRFLASRIGAVLVSVGYRLAPEHKFPAGLEDATAAWRWFAANAAVLGCDTRRLAIAGDSAGGNLAAVVARIARDEGIAPAMQLLIYPAVDFSMDTASHRSLADGFLLTASLMRWFGGHYLDSPEQIDDPRVSPLRAADLSGLPPAIVVTAGFDPLRDEGQAYADRLHAAGVKTIHRPFDDLIHGFLNMRGTVQGAARAMDDIAAGVRHELAQIA